MKDLMLVRCIPRLVGIAAVVALTQSASASVVWEAVDLPIEGNSWLQQFAVHGQATTLFDKITVELPSDSTYTFETPTVMSAFTDGTNHKLINWVQQSAGSKIAIASGDDQNWAGWTLHFNGDAPKGNEKGVILLLTASLNGVLESTAEMTYNANKNGEWVWQVKALYDRDDVGAVVPEPTTIISGTFLLLPFGVSLLRLRRTCHRSNQNQPFRVESKPATLSAGPFKTSFSFL